ncbi:Tyrosineprotein phosphatase nonreceptor type 13like [Caligus rogercresseyi]|uniref:Tyrosineprotein phosphatase nonreceptor type 13like n=1 Tax=Caligus rogercresseyi TaxID=217165 RepID=A0A7T8K0X0_CALRO|nr:Tyrosineprotein phosphatase nonreceptor type 13like [Caligus rogercresseyi]
MSALHRERLRLTTDLSSLPPATKKAESDLDFDAMEVKAIPLRTPSSDYQNIAFP